MHHMDPYRLPPGRIASLIDFEQILTDNITLCEWPERLGKVVWEEHLEKRRANILEVKFSGIGVQEVSSRPLRGRQSAENDAPPCSCPSFHPVETD